MNNGALRVIETEFFHRVANGRKRRCTITSLWDGDTELTTKSEIKDHIVGYYKSLFRADPPSNIHLSQEVWRDNFCLSNAASEHLIRPFEIEELDKIIRETKLNTAPGPDGFSVPFYRAFWPQVRNDLYEMLILLHNEELDLKRLNFGVISLIPKSSNPTYIKQFRPICVLNDCFKFLSKAVTNRLTEVANDVISPTQTAFIPGRFILEGCVIIHEVLHEMRTRNLEGIVLKIDFEKAYDKVRWDFLIEVMERKGFPTKWISWIKSCVMGGRVCVNINGERTDFFRTFRGLRQGDPLSPLLFNLVSDALAVMFDSAKRAGVLKGLVPSIFPGGITHLQYADDTVLFIANEDKQIVATKFILYCFEEMASLKINFHKSEVFTLGMNEIDTLRVAQMLNCPVGCFPMKYLGLPISPDKILNHDFKFLGQKLEKRLGTWGAGDLSHAGRAVQINACLSSIPSYAMGFYQLPEGVHQRFDKIRNRYYWAGNKLKGKYHMVKWEDMAFPKDFGGLGFTETRKMNIALLAIWIINIESDDQSLCLEVLRRKYLQERGVFQCKSDFGSQFWRGLLNVRKWLNLGAEWKIGKGSHVYFWKDTWFCNCPLSVRYPAVFRICNQQEVMVSHVAQRRLECFSFGRSFGPEELTEWGELTKTIDDLEVTDEADRLLWGLATTKRYTTKSMYRTLTFRGLREVNSDMWKSPCPTKIKHFLWLALRDRIQSAEQLKKKKREGSESCQLCGNLESTNHILFNCDMARLMWCICRDVLNWNVIPRCFDDFFLLCSSDTNPSSIRVCMSMLAAVCWNLWLTRNNMVFRDRLLYSPLTLAFQIASNLLQWRKLCQPEDVPKLEVMVDRIKSVASSLKPQRTGVG